MDAPKVTDGEEASIFDVLPRDIVCAILGYLSIKDVVLTERVSKLWRDLVWKSCVRADFAEIDLWTKTDLTPPDSTATTLFGKLPIPRLILLRCGVRAAPPTSTLPWLNTQFPSLRFLELHTLSRLPAATMINVIASAPLLRMIVINSCVLVNDDVLGAISKLKNLAVLSISRAIEVTAAGCNALATINSPLAYLDLDDWPKLPGAAEALQPLSKSEKLCSSLRVLRLHDFALSSEALDSICMFSRLESLQLSRCAYTQNDLQLRLCIATLSNLRALALQDMQCITDSVLETIGQLPHLGFLNLTHSHPCRRAALDRLRSQRPQLAIFFLGH